MQKLRDFIIQDFSGGLVTNKGDYEMNRNEMVRLENFNVDNRGRAVRRPGSVQFGTGSFQVLGGMSAHFGATGVANRTFLIWGNSATATKSYLATTTLASSVATGDTSITVDSTAGFAAAPGSIEIEGDTITYTAVPDGTHFTVTAATIARAHPQGASVNQFRDVASTSDTRSGAGACVIGNTLIYADYGGMVSSADGQSFSAITDGGNAPAGLFPTVYRDRVYVAGSGVADAADTRNGDPIRVSFSEAGSGIAWGDYTTDFFDVEDSRRELISGFYVLNDRLLVFKQTSTFYYNEAQLKQVSTRVGAYNNEVIKEIDGVIYTFCPSGVFATNGVSVKKISEPIEKYLNVFVPQYDAQRLRVVTNCFAGVYDKKYFLYLGTLNFPSNAVKSETFYGVTLVFDTQRNNWTMYSGTSTDFQFNGFISMPSFYAGNAWQGVEAIFGASTVTATALGIQRLFNNRERGAGYEPVGKDLTADSISNSNTSGVPISAALETPWYDIGNPTWLKRFLHIRVLVEEGDFDVFYKLDKGDRTTDWIPLGNFKDTNRRADCSDTDGYRIKLMATSASTTVNSILNGFVVEEIYAIDQQ